MEALRNEIRIVAEGLEDMRKEFAGFKEWRGAITKELEGFRDWRTGVSQELSAIKKEVGSMRTDLKTFDQRLQTVEAKVRL